MPAFDPLPATLADVLRAVAKALVDREAQGTRFVARDAAIHPISPAGRQLDAEDPEVCPGCESTLEPVTGNGFGVDHQGMLIG